MESELSDMQFKGIIKMIIALIKKDTLKEELIEYLQGLVKTDKQIGRHKSLYK